VGRTALKGAKRLYEDPMMLETGIAEGVGSLLVGGPTAKALKYGALATTGAKEGGRAAKLIEAAAFPTSVGALEGGGAFVDVAQQIMAIPEAELSQQSPEYNNLRSQGMSDQQAKVELAARAGNVASAIAFPVGAATGPLVRGFEMNPLKGAVRGSTKEMLKDASKEFVEETIQSGTSPLAGNIGQQVSGTDPNRDLTLGVGEQAIQGGIFGAGSTGAIQGPGVALRGTAELALKGANKLLEGGKQAKEAAAAASATSAQTVGSEVATQAQQAPAVADALRSLSTEATPTEGSSAQDAEDLAAKTQTNEDYIERVGKASELQPEDTKGLTKTIRDALVNLSTEQGSTPNKFQAIFTAARVAKDENASEEDRISAGTFIVEQLEKNKKLFQEDLPDFLANVDQSRPEFTQFDNYSKILNKLQEVPEIKEAMDWAQTKMKMNDRDLAALDPASDEMQDVVNNAIRVATHTPQAMNVNTATHILQQAEDGKVELTDQEKQAIANSVSMLNADKTTEPKVETTETGTKEAKPTKTPIKGPSMSIVTRQIEDEGGDQAHKKSISQHVTAINQAVLSGKVSDIRNAIVDLGNFARSQNNKLDAIKQAIINGDRKRVPYEALGSKGRFLPADGTFSVYYNPGTPQSQHLHEKVHQEASVLANLYNEMIPIILEPILNHCLYLLLKDPPVDLLHQQSQRGAQQLQLRPSRSRSPPPRRLRPPKRRRRRKYQNDQNPESDSRKSRRCLRRNWLLIIMSYWIWPIRESILRRIHARSRPLSGKCVVASFLKPILNPESRLSKPRSCQLVGWNRA